MSRKLLFGLGTLALLAGALLAVLWFRETGISSAPSAPSVVNKSVLIAAHPLPAGTLLRASDVAWGAIPAADVDGTDIVRSAGAETAFLGAATRRPFRAGERLTGAALVKPGNPEFLAATLKPGYRAVSIDVDATQSTSGMLLPGDEVDIVLTQNFSTQDNDIGHKALGETVLHGLRVIAVDQTLIAPAAATPADNASHMPKNVTLEVTERQATMLLVAQQLGKIALTLRGQLDPDHVPAVSRTITRPTWASDVSPALGGHAAPPPPVSPSRPSLPAAPAAGQQGSIEVMHGSKIERLCLTSTRLSPCS